MHLAYLFDRVLPAHETDSEQALRTVAALARRGVRVTLVLPHPPGRPPTADALRRHYSVEGDFEVAPIPTPLAGQDTVRKWSHALRALRSSAARDADVVYTRNFPTLFAAAATLDRPFAYETYRPWFDQFPILRWPFRQAMRRPQFLGAVLHSDFARQRYLALGVDPDRLRVVHNGFEPSHFRPPMDRGAAREALGLPKDRPIVTYTGHVNATKGLNVAIDMAKRLPDVLFVIVGSRGRGLVERLAEPLANVRVEPWAPMETVATHLFAADVLLQPPSRVPLGLIGNTVLPMKLFLYLAAGRPILAPRSPDTAELLRDDENAVLVPPGDAVAAAEALRRLLADPERVARLGAAAFATSEGLTWDARAEKIERFLCDSLSRRS